MALEVVRRMSPGRCVVVPCPRQTWRSSAAFGLAATANVNELEVLVDAIPPIRGKRRRPRRRPATVYADRAYDSDPHRRRLSRRRIRPIIARRRTSHGSGLGRYRWVVERTISWLHRPRKLRLRTDWRADIHEAFMSLCCSLICWNVLTSSFC